MGSIEGGYSANEIQYAYIGGRERDREREGIERDNTEARKRVVNWRINFLPCVTSVCIFFLPFVSHISVGEYSSVTRRVLPVIVLG